MTREFLDYQLGRMSVIRGMPPDSDGYWQALQDIPEALLEAAITHALKTRAWFPTPAEVRLDVDAVQRQRHPIATPPTSRLVPVAGDKRAHIPNPLGGKGIDVAVTREPHYHCDACDDRGRVMCWCGDQPSTREPWLPMRRCLRRQPHADHEWVEDCPCAPTNPVIQRRREAQGVRYSQEPEVHGHRRAG